MWVYNKKNEPILHSDVTLLTIKNNIGVAWDLHKDNDPMVSSVKRSLLELMISQNIKS